MPGQRSDFTRNERRIIDAAARLLSEAPAAGMSEIASAAGLGRATLYRHFPTRETLIAGMRAEAYAAVAAVIAARGADRAGVDLPRLVQELLAVGERYRIVFAAPSDAQARAAAGVRFEEPLTELVGRAQQEGLLDPALSPEWVLIALAGLLGAALRARAEGRLSGGEARALVLRGLLAGFGAAGSSDPLDPSPETPPAVRAAAR